MNRDPQQAGGALTTTQPARARTLPSPPNMSTWTPLCVDGVFMYTDPRFGDHRGFFQELFHKDKYPSHVQPAEAGGLLITTTRTQNGARHTVRVDAHHTHADSLHGG